MSDRMHLRTLVESRQRAANCFVRAAGLLLTFPMPNDEELAAALLHATRGLYAMAQMDREGAVADLAIETLRRISREKSA